MNKSFLSVLMLLLVGTLFVGCSDDNVQLEGNELISEDNFLNYGGEGVLFSTEFFSFSIHFY